MAIVIRWQVSLRLDRRRVGGQVIIPPEAWREYGFRAGDEVVFLPTNYKGKDSRPMSDVLKQIVEKLYDGDDEAVAELTQQALAKGLTPVAVLDGGLIAGMDRVGVDFRDGELFIPEVLVAARAMHAGMNILRPLLAESDVPSAGKVVIGTVEGDLHDIGKNLVAMMLEGGGFEIVDLGTDAPPDRFVEAVKAERPALIGLSALLTTTMPAMKCTIDALVEAGLREKVKVMVGGAPVTRSFADEIGADGYAPDAGTAVQIARALLEPRRLLRR